MKFAFSFAELVNLSLFDEDLYRVRSGDDVSDERFAILQSRASEVVKIYAKHNPELDDLSLKELKVLAKTSLDVDRLLTAIAISAD